MKTITAIWILICLLILVSVFSGLKINQLTFERDLYLNRLYDKDRIIDMWEERATNQLKLVQNYCDDLSEKYSFVIFNASDCALITETQQMVCEKNNPLFVIQN